MSPGPPRTHRPTTTTALANARNAGPPPAILRPSALTAGSVAPRRARINRRGGGDVRSRPPVTTLSRVDAYLALVSRREVRDYDARPLPEDAVRRILEAGRLAGSSRNRQQRRFIAVRDPGVRAALAEIAHTPSNVRTAALVIAVVTWGRGPAGLDAGRAAQNMMIAAWNEGIGSCPHRIHNARRGR